MSDKLQLVADSLTGRFAIDDKLKVVGHFIGRNE